ncbi:hypothetical protein P43SY_001551 [Pythium insidiosum]|uniref:Uncharacterized protein n=1 Tax=Pythium insidiosum TaxID=114742 RepID=A0AAD5M3Y8_PYTIN|nr:hypothetical protein P43SY_001551 [Pythium insidiosum]
MQPLLYFYKYLQPLPDGRKLSLRLPLTVVCEKVDGREYVLWLASDLAGNVVTEDKGTTWRKRLLAELTGGKVVVEATGDGHQDEVIAVRNVARKFNDSSVAEFNAYRMPIPMSVQELPDSAVFIHESIRSL